ncbi:hypothetical protein, partial [Sutterella wadsworthensis]|uniref:hypothetical protein n=1 Tax=Sutterella wadsworthensis TaxID=40545 RepID=UPI003FEFD871
NAFKICFFNLSKISIPVHLEAAYFFRLERVSHHRRLLGAERPTKHTRTLSQSAQLLHHIILEPAVR